MIARTIGLPEAKATYRHPAGCYAMRTLLFLFAMTLTGCEIHDSTAVVNAGATESSGDAIADSVGRTADTAGGAAVSNGTATINSAPASRASQQRGACRLQDGQVLPENRLRAVGTEPFWGARIEGRCVTYSHPDDQAGTRIWTRFSGTVEAGQWRGAHLGQTFVLRTRPQADCSDGMSDRRYPMAVSLSVAGEERQGCAERL